MIGTRPSFSLPLLSDTMSTIVSKVSTALDAIADSIADKASPAALNLNADVSFLGNRATNLGGAVFVAGNAPTAAGSMYYSAGEFYLVDSTGTIQVTSLGHLNPTGFGGIGGDYGSPNPALVSYNNAAGEYRLYVNPATPTWAGIATKYVLLEGTNGTVKLDVDNAISGNNTAHFKSFPASGVSFMVYDASDGSIKDGTATGPSNALVSTSSIKATALKFSTAVRVIVPAPDLKPHGTSTITANYDATHKSLKFWRWANDGNTDPIFAPVRIPKGAQLSSYGFHVNKTSDATHHLHAKLIKCTSAGVVSVDDTNNATGIDYAANNPGFTDVDPTNAPAISGPAANTESWQLLVYSDGTVGGDDLYWAYYEYLVP